MLSRHRLVRTLATAVILTVAFAVSACSVQQPAAPAAPAPAPAQPAPTAPAPAPAQPAPAAPAAPQVQEMQPATIKVMVLPGAQAYPVWVMQNRGIADKYKLTLDVGTVASPAAQATQMQLPDFQAGFGSWVTVALLRAQGHKLVNVNPMFGYYTNDIVVRNDSPIQTFADLKGKRIGTFGNAAAGTTWLFRMIGVKFFDFDPLADAQWQTAAPPVLSGMLEKGELDAILSLDPFIIQLLETGKFRSIGNIGNLWREKTGQNPMLVAVTMNEDWAAKNADAAKRFVQAYGEALQYLKTNVDVWAEIAKEYGIETEAGAKLLRERTAPGLFTQWDQAFIQAQYDYNAEIHKTFPGAEGIPKDIPDGTFTLDYAAK